jgi:branched-chain amino acid transport system permease protein
MTTLAFGQMLFFVFYDTPIGGGADGVFIQRPDLGFTVTRAGRIPIFLLINLGALAAIYALLWWLMHTLFGHMLLGIRANEDRMRAMGHNVARLKLAAFVLGGIVAGVAGHMAAMTDAFVNPELLGGIAHGRGAADRAARGGIGGCWSIRCLCLTLIGELGSRITERQRLVEGVVLAAVLLLRRITA